MSATRRTAGHACRTFVPLAFVLEALAARNSPHHARQYGKGYVGMFDKGLTAEVYRELESSGVTHRCAECKRWVTVTPSPFRPCATHAALTRTTAAERRELARRPVVLTVRANADPKVAAKVLPQLPALGFDVRHAQAAEVRGKGSRPWSARPHAEVAR